MMNLHQSDDLEYTGERMVPGRAARSTFWEHVYRYRFAVGYAPGRRVLDVACGEGYGAAALRAAGARGVIGADLCKASCAHARAKYALDVAVADAVLLPFRDRSFDLIVSLETLEHLRNPDRFLDECARLLAPDGVLIASTPNRPVYREAVLEATGTLNPFHACEWDEDELVAALGRRFRSVALFVQGLRSAAWWSARSLAAAWPWARVRGYQRLRRLMNPNLTDRADGDPPRDAARLILEPDRGRAALTNPYEVLARSPRTGERPLYFIAVASHLPVRRPR
jgi:SAM-dependent methyltransferase